MSAGDLLEIQPSELIFPFELQKQSSCSIQLTNKTDQYVAYKVKTTHPKKYCVRPNAGVILPRRKCDVTGWFACTKELILQIGCSDRLCKLQGRPRRTCDVGDRFLIQSVVANDGATIKDLTDDMFVKEPGKVVEEFKISVVYVPASLLPVPEDSEEDSSPWSSMMENGNKNSSSFNSVIERSEPGEASEKHREEEVASIKLEQQHKADIKLQDATTQPVVSNKDEKDSTANNVTVFSYSDLQQATSDFNESNMLGQGGFVKVYKGNLLGNEVAIKILLSPDNPHQVKAFHQEIDILCRVKHPHLVRLIGACPDKYTLIYEFMHGGTLEARLANDDLPWQSRIRIATEICDALKFLHSLKPSFVVHGDLKPENVLLDANGKSKLSDFGICRLIPGSSTTTTAHHTTFSFQGSHGYLDPMFLVLGRLTPKVDVYAFGMVLLRLLTNKKAGYDLIVEVVDAVNEKCLDNVLDTATNWPSHFAEELANLALRCCSFQLRERPNLADEVFKKLEKMKLESSA